MTTTAPMTPDDVRKVWAAGVRDTERFNLGKGFLCHRFEGVEYYDALGILCEIGVEAGVIDEGIWSMIDERDGGGATLPLAPLIKCKKYGGDYEQGVLPKEIVTWAGLKSQNPCIVLTLKERELLGLPQRYLWPVGYGQKLSPVPLSQIADHGSVTRDQIAILIEGL